MQGYLEQGIQTPMVQGQSTKLILMIQWIRNSRLSIKNSLSDATWWVRPSTHLRPSIPTLDYIVDSIIDSILVDFIVFDSICF